MNARNILILCPDRRMLAELAPMVAQHLPGAVSRELTMYPAPNTLAEVLGPQAPEICFLDTASNQEMGLDLIREIQARAPATSIVVLMQENDPDLILRCLRQGAAEFLLRPFTADQMTPVLARLVQMNSNGNVVGGAKIYCVMPVKGGCGSTTIACSLAYNLKRLGAKKGLLADLDPYTGTVSFLLKLRSNYSFLDALSRTGSLDADLWRGLVVTWQGIDVLLSPENIIDSNIDPGDPGPIIEFARQIYDSVTLDSGGPHGPWALAMAVLCDELLLVTTNELPALRASQRVLTILDRNRVDRAKIRLIVNRYSSDIGLKQEAIETALHTDVYHVIPSDYESVQRALVEGKPLPAGTAVGKSIAELADRLAGLRPDAEEPKRKKSFGWGSLLSLVSRTNS